MAKKIKDKNKKVVKEQISMKGPTANMCFGFQYVTTNKQYRFDKLDKSIKLNAYNGLFEKLEELSRMTPSQAHLLGKVKGMEKIPYKQLSDNLKKVCDGIDIITKDSKLAIFRFGNQGYRLICKDDIMQSNLMHVIAFDCDFSAYNHG